MKETYPIFVSESVVAFLENEMTASSIHLGERSVITSLDPKANKLQITYQGVSILLENPLIKNNDGQYEYHLDPLEGISHSQFKGTGDEVEGIVHDFQTMLNSIEQKETGTFALREVSV